MKKVIQISVMSVMAAAFAATPALADKYVFYGNSHHGYNKYDKHSSKHYDKNYSKHYDKYYDKYRDRGHVVHRYPSYPTKKIYINSYSSHYPTSYSSYPSSYSYSQVRCTNSTNPLGLLLGGVAGGVIGNSIGKGQGRTVATISGAVLGAGLGSNTLSQHCNEQVFEQVPVGTPVVWQTAGAQEYYSVTPTNDYRTEGRYCREYQAVSTVGGRQQQTYGTACMQPDGSWEIVN